MSAQSVASRSSQSKHALDPDDVIAARALEFAQWARNNARIVIGVAVVALVAVAAAFYYFGVYRPQRQARAGAEFMTLQATVAGGNAQQATAALERYIHRYDGTTYADEATLALAQLQLREGQPAKAVATLQAPASDIKGSPMGAQAALLLAAAQQQAGQTDPAIATYRKVADAAPMEFHRKEALSNAAILQEQKGDWAGAVASYTRLAEGAEKGSAERSVFEMRLAEAQGHLAAK